ncbi:MAG: hypothetical protein II007_03340 [Gammaproteobacteria bacterium]|nr:hypothetical protein [Gammaproteobacteria bacterium]
MTPEQLFVYTEEVNIHAQLALSNFVTFQNIVHNHEDRQRREAWMHLQSFLSHFGMVSKLLYAPSSRAQVSRERARILRDHLETDSSSALNDRDARNAVEHLDERMDNWLTQEGKGILESVFPNRRAYDYLSKERWVVRRVYLVEEDIFITQESDGPKEMALQPLAEELSRIISVSNQRLSNDSPYHIIQPS